MYKLILLVLLTPLVAGAASPGLTVCDGVLMKEDRAWRGIGVNYFDCFLRTLGNGNDTSYDAGFRILAERRIPFARFCATGFWPRDMKLYQRDRAEYFRRLDGVVKSAQKHGVGLIPSLFWQVACVPDLVGEPVNQWGNPQSKTHAWMREYVREVVTRHRGSSAIWGWEFGNEYSLACNLPNASSHRAPVHPTLGAATNRTERDDLTFAMVRVAFTEFAKAVREIDPDRLIVTGDSFPRLSAWHQEHEKSWKHDTKEQFQEMLEKATPAPVNGISLHAYEDDDQRFAWAVEVSRKLKKPIFIGEFGAQKETTEQAAKFHRLLKAIRSADIPLAAVWVFDYKRQGEFNLMPDTPRGYQLDAIAPTP
jgi:hypothetical protein